MAGTPTVTGAASESRFRCMAAVLMAVDANKTALLVNIGCKIVPLNTVRSRDIIAWCVHGVRRAIFPMVIVLVSAMEITAHIVTIVTTQALLV